MRHVLIATLSSFIFKINEGLETISLSFSKKTIISLLFLVSSFALFSQTPCKIYTNTTGTQTQSANSPTTGSGSSCQSQGTFCSASGGLTAGSVIHLNITINTYSTFPSNAVTFNIYEGSGAAAPFTYTATPTRSLTYAELVTGGGTDYTVVNSGTKALQLCYTYTNAIGTFSHTWSVSWNCAPIVPNVTATVSNTCPSTTVNLTTLADTGNKPSASTTVWSLNNPLLNASDTLTTAQASAISTSGTYYVYYRKTATGCYSDADNVAVTINTNCPCTTPTSNNAIVTNSTCNGATMNANGSIAISGITNANRYAFNTSNGTGLTYAAANNIVGSTINITGLTNTTTTLAYTIRIYNGADNCYKDIQAILPAKNCSEACYTNTCFNTSMLKN